MKRGRGNVHAFVLSMLVCLGGIAAGNATSSESGVMPKTILDAMLENESKVKNIACKAEYLDWSSAQSRQEEYERQMKAGHPETANRRREREYVAYRYEFTFDNQGRLRIEELQATGDAQGNIIAVDLDDTCTWDGQTAMYLYPRGAVTQGRITSQKPPSLMDDYQDPADIFRVAFRRTLQMALTRADSEVRARTESGKYRVEILWKGKTKAIGLVDPACGYSVPHEVIYDNAGKPLLTCDASYREVAPGIWYPMEGVKVVGDPEKPSNKRTVKVTSIKINDPNFTNSVFRIDFPPGTRVYDTVTGTNYVVGEPMSLGLGNDSTEPTAGQIAAEELKRIGESVNSKGETETLELFLPVARQALRNNEPFVLDAATCKLVNPASTPQSEQADKYFQQAGAGDLAWDGRFVATRGASLVTPKQESARPMKHTKARRAHLYELAKDVKLPYWTLVVTKEGAYYLLSVRRIEEKGIRVAYRKLAPDEIAFHTQVPAEEAQKP